MSVKIIADSTCDLTKELLDKYDIAILPLHIVLGETEYKDGSEILIAQDEKNPRRLTPRECARLQGFPETFKIPVSDTQAYKQFGNSVVVPLMENVAKLIVEKLNECEAEKSGKRLSESVFFGCGSKEAIQR